MVKLRFTRGARWVRTITEAGGWGGRTSMLAVVTVIAISACLAITAMPAQALTGTWVYNYETSPTVGLMCMGTSGGHNNTNAVLWQCQVNAKNQYWHFSGSPIYVTGQPFYNLVNANNDCLGTSGGNVGEGTDVVAWGCLGTSHPDQYWWAYATTCSGYYILLNAKAFEKNLLEVVGVAGGVIKDGTDLVLWKWQQKCNNQGWQGPSFPS